MCRMKRLILTLKKSLVLLAGLGLAGSQMACSDRLAASALPSKVGNGFADMAIRAGDRATAQDAVTISAAMIFRKGVRDWFSTCSGTLIATNIVLTAGHCVTATDSTELHFDHLLVTFGVDPLEEPEFQKHRILAVRLHPGFKAPRKGSYADMADVNDVAVVLIEGFAAKPFKPAALADAGTDLTADLPVVVAGYGAPDEFDMSNRLRYLPSTVVGPVPRSGQFVAKPLYRESTTTLGDSGGPVYLETPQGLVLVGIHSGVLWDHLSIFESVPRHAAWIRSAARDLSALGFRARTPPVQETQADSAPSTAQTPSGM
jgi:secreted trypsin-like serine protease